MQEKNDSKKPAFEKYFLFFLGVLLCLISIVLVLNIGYVGRALTLPFVYLFGTMAYVIYAIIYIFGFYMLIKVKTLKVKKKKYIFGFLITFIGAAIILSYAVNSSASAESYKAVFNSFSEGKNYFTEKTIDLLQSKPGYGGGFVGYALAGIFAKVNGGFVYFVGIMIVILGLITMFFDPIMTLLNKNKTPKQTKEIPASESKKSSFSFKGLFKKEKKPEVEEDYDYISEASNINLARATPAPAPAPVEQPKPAEPTPAVADAYTQVNRFNPYYGYDNGAFVPAHFYRNGAPAANPNPRPQFNAFEQAKPAVEEKSPEEILLEANERQTELEKAEQLQLNFDEPAPEPAPAPAPVPEPVRMPEPEFEPAPEPKPVVRKPVKWVPPSMELLENVEDSDALEKNTQLAEQRKVIIDRVLSNFAVRASVVDYTIGPAVTRFNIDYDSNVSVRQVNNLVEDLSRQLGGVAVRFESVVEGSTFSGLEISNAVTRSVYFKELYEKLPDVKKHPLAVGFGKNISGDIVWADFNKFPHALVAGTTGSGKSVFIHSLIATLIMRNSPDNLRLALIDPKKVEMVKYRDMPHLLCPVIDDPEQAKLFFNKLVDEMNKRYVMFQEADGSVELDEYNEWAQENGKEKLPSIIVIVDEFGDLVESCKEISQPILLLGQKARACGIHMLIATQSPTSNIITGTIKNNLPTHVALSTANVTQSITILGEGGAEKLMGHGDMLVQSPLVSRVGLARLQGCFVQKKEIMRIIGYLKEHYELHYNEKFLNLVDEAAQMGRDAVANGSIGASMDPAEENRYQGIKEWVMSQQFMSMSRIQGECSVGFNRARRFFVRLQQEGVIATEPDGNRGCPVLMHDDYVS